jgi:hypothetical protein
MSFLYWKLITKKQIIHDALEPRHAILAKRIMDAAYAGEVINPSDIDEFNNPATILAKLGRVPWCQYNIFVKRNGDHYSSEPVKNGHSIKRMGFHLQPRGRLEPYPLIETRSSTQLEKIHTAAHPAMVR